MYTGDGKQRLAGITREELEVDRSATAPHTALLARVIRERLQASWAIAETGAAGPTGNRYGDPPGHAALAVSGPIERTQVIETGESDRRRNMATFALAALRLLHDTIEEQERRP